MRKRKRVVITCKGKSTVTLACEDVTHNFGANNQLVVLLSGRVQWCNNHGCTIGTEFSAAVFSDVEHCLWTGTEEDA